MTYFHGTSSIYAEQIRAEGLVPATSGTAHQWAAQAGWSIPSNNANRAASVYLTATRSHAAIYAARAVEVTGGEAVIIEVTIDDSFIVIRDEDDSQGVRIESAIPAFRIA